MSAAVTNMIMAGIVAKGIGVILIIFGIGVVIGIVLTAALTSRLRRTKKRRPPLCQRPARRSPSRNQ